MPLDSFPGIVQAMDKTLLDTFGITVTHSPAAGGSHVVGGIFDERHEAIEILDGVPVSAIRPMIQFQISEMSPEPVVSDMFLINGNNYRATDVQPDGHGWAKVFLIHES